MHVCSKGESYVLEVADFRGSVELLSVLVPWHVKGCGPVWSIFFYLPVRQPLCHKSEHANTILLCRCGFELEEGRDARIDTLGDIEASLFSGFEGGRADARSFHASHMSQKKKTSYLTV